MDPGLCRTGVRDRPDRQVLRHLRQVRDDVRYRASMKLETSPFSRSRSITSTLWAGTSRRMSQARCVTIVVVPTPPLVP